MVCPEEVKRNDAIFWVQVVLDGVEEIWERGLEEHIKELCGDKNTNTSG